MSSLLRSNIENGIASDIAHNRDGTTGETYFLRKTKKYDGTAPCGSVLLKTDGPYIYKSILREIKAEKVSLETAKKYIQVEFRRKVSLKQCFEHIDIDLMYQGKGTHPDSRHSDYSDKDYQKTSFVEAHIGLSVAVELQKIYKEIVRKNGRIKRIIGNSENPVVEIIFIRDIFFKEAILPVLVQAIEITIEYKK